MHSFTGPEGTQFNYNGDFSGLIWVGVSDDQVRESDPSRGFIVEIPFEDLKALVAQYVAGRAIAFLENAEPDEILSGVIADFGT